MLPYDRSANPIQGPDAGEAWLPAERQVADPDTFKLGRSPNDTRCSIDLATAMYTDLDTGEVRSWWANKQYKEAKNKAYARSLAEQRMVSSDMQNLWGRKPEFFDDWFGGFTPEYRLPSPRADLTQINEVYGGDGPWPPGPLPGQYY